MNQSFIFRYVNIIISLFSEDIAQFHDG